MRRHFASLLCVCLTTSALSAAGKDIYRAPSREPTPWETQLLEYANRFRADPAAEADRMVPGRGEILSHLETDYGMFRREMKTLRPAPPLVFNLHLIDAARKHAHYLIVNRVVSHDETAGKPGFTGRTFRHRAKAAGYMGAQAENVGNSMGGPWGSIRAFVIDYGPAPGWMRPGRGHRKSLINPRHREIGIGALPNGTTLTAVVQVFGSGHRKRYAGGVVYLDRNRNGFYDLDEGIGGVTISADDGASTSTWSSGAYVLALRANAGAKLTAGAGDAAFSRTFSPGRQNIKFDWVVDPEKDGSTAAKLKECRIDKLIADAENAAGVGSKPARAALLALLVESENGNLGESRRKRADELTKEAKQKLEKDRNAVRAALESGNQRSIGRVLNEYRSTAAEQWFLDAQLFAAVKADMRQWQALPRNARVPPHAKALVLRNLYQLEKRIRTEEFRRATVELTDRLTKRLR